MAGARSKAKTRDGSVTDLGQWRQILPAISISAGVLGVLLLAAILQDGGESSRVDPPRGPIRSSPTLASDPLPTPSSAAPTNLPPPPPAPSGDLLNLARRVERDQARIASKPSGWTLQFMVACDPANVRPPVASLSAESEFYLLAKLDGERACFRLCWGLFDSRAQAVAIREFPAALASITDRPQPLPVAQALP